MRLYWSAATIITLLTWWRSQYVSDAITHSTPDRMWGGGLTPGAISFVYAYSYAGPEAKGIAVEFRLPNDGWTWFSTRYGKHRWPSERFLPTWLPRWRLTSHDENQPIETAASPFTDSESSRYTPFYGAPYFADGPPEPSRGVEVFPNSISLPLYIPLVVCAAMLLRTCWRRRPHTATLCPNCRYDLRATPVRCPECGWTPEAANASPSSR